MDFKIILMSPYENIDIVNDNIDVKIALSSDLVYSGTLFTLSNIQYLLDESDAEYFRVKDMIIVKDLTQYTINKTIKSIIEEELMDSYMSMTGIVKEVFTNANGYKDLKNWGSPLNGFYK